MIFVDFALPVQFGDGFDRCFVFGPSNSRPVAQKLETRMVGADWENVPLKIFSYVEWLSESQIL